MFSPSLIAGAEYQLIFKESLAHKDDAIKAKDDLIKTLQDKLSTKNPSPTATEKPQTGPATANGGSENTVNSGNGNTFGQPATPKPKQK